MLTVHEIAKRAGVSIGTVDRVIHNRGRVKEETRLKIEEIIKIEGYQPNPLARHLKQGKNYRLGVLLPELEKESRYWELIYNSILKAVGSFAAFSIKVEFFPFIRPDKTSLSSAFAKMIGSSCDAYIIAPIMQEETLALLTQTSLSAPYCFIDCPLPGAAPFATVAQDPFQGGVVAGRLMQTLSHSSGPFAVIRPYREAFNLNERVRGFRSWFSRSCPSDCIIDISASDLEPSKLFAKVEDALRSRPDIKGFFAVTSVGHMVADFLGARGLKENKVFIAYDLVSENIRCLENGLIDCLISQRPEEQGRIVVDQLYRKLVLRDECGSNILMPIDIFFKENLIC